MLVDELRKRLRSQANPRVASDLAWFFKTGPGEYGEGDKFLGLKVPQTRAIAKEFKDANLTDIDELVGSEYHEERFCALVILTTKYEKSKEPETRKNLFDHYISLYDRGVVNGWDLVDVTANRFGKQLVGDPEAIDFLLALARTKDLWKQRLSVILTFASIAEYDFAPTLIVCEDLVDHEHDLMHKAIGWALREVGNRDLKPLREFLEVHAATMPRTALRYAIEKLGEKERQDWLSRKAQALQERDH